MCQASLLYISTPSALFFSFQLILLSTSHTQFTIEIIYMKTIPNMNPVIPNFCDIIYKFLGQIYLSDWIQGCMRSIIRKWKKNKRSSTWLLARWMGRWVDGDIGPMSNVSNWVYIRVRVRWIQSHSQPGELDTTFHWPLACLCVYTKWMQRFMFNPLLLQLCAIRI
jgi:hypothetical protein